MAIDTSKIEGYAEMSLEDKVKALEAFEMDAPAADESEIDKYKRLLSKANAEAASWKTQYRDKLTAQEKADAERADADKALREEVEALRRDKTVNSYMAQYVALGYDADLAKETAEAMADGKFDVVFNNQKKASETMKSKIESDVLANQNKLTPGSTPNSKDMDDKITAAFRSAAGLI